MFNAGSQAKLCGLCSMDRWGHSSQRGGGTTGRGGGERQKLGSRNKNILLDEEKSLDLSDFFDVWEAI